ncbi:MAG: PsbP-related protein [Armatimonadota bacterium]|jgi:hypothetical protein
MRTLALFVAVCAILSLCMVVAAQDEFAPPVPVEVDEPVDSQSPPDVMSDAPPAPPPPDGVSDAAPAPPPPPAPPARPDHDARRDPANRRPVNPAAMGQKIVIGPTDAQGAPRKYRGSVTVSAVVPEGTKVASVKLFCNNALVDQKSQAPYEAKFDTTTISDGPHIFKAIGSDTSGKQVWSAMTRVEIINTAASSRAALRGPGAATAPSSPRPPALPAPPAGQPEPPIPTPVKPGAPADGTKVTQPEPPASTPVKPGAPASAMDGTPYTSTKYGFSVNHPAGWTAQDKTAAMKPKKSGNAWIEFNAADKSAGLVINIKRSQLALNSDADTFAKYNPYVDSWTRKTVDGGQAFSTTTTESAQKVIHRLILIKSGYAWMLNCVDTSGKDAANSAKLFESVVNSFRVQIPDKLPPVRVIEVK